MGKEFIEYHSENGRIPYSASNICLCLTQYARNYIKQKRQLIKDVNDNVRDAVLVDAINYLGAKGWCDFALYTNDLYEDRIDDEYVEPQALLTVIEHHFANYIFEQNLVESVLRNNHMNECTEQFDANDGGLVIVDFINYITKLNGYDRIFTIKDLYEKYKIQQHDKEINQLREFLELTSKYCEKIANGESIDSIFRKKSREYNLMNSWDAREYNEEIYAMTYAYVKLNNKNKTQIPAINKKILEMKKRK